MYIGDTKLSTIASLLYGVHLALGINNIKESPDFMKFHTWVRDKFELTIIYKFWRAFYPFHYQFTTIKILFNQSTAVSEKISFWAGKKSDGKLTSSSCKFRIIYVKILG